MSVGQELTSHSSSSGPLVHCLYEPDTGSWQYICADPATGKCAIIDPVLDFHPAHARTSTESAEKLLGIVKQHGYDVQWILDTHPHADHLTAAPYVRSQLGGKTAIGEKVAAVHGRVMGHDDYLRRDCGLESEPFTIAIGKV